jgi:hypothetical protein
VFGQGSGEIREHVHLGIVAPIPIASVEPGLQFRPHRRGFLVQESLQGFFLILVQRDLIVLQQVFDVGEPGDGIRNLRLILVSSAAAATAIRATTHQGIDIGIGKDNLVLGKSRHSQQQ